MKKVIIAMALSFVFGFGAGACKKGDSKKADAPKKSELMKKFEAIEKKACACKDVKCAGAVSKEMMELAKDKPSEEEQKKLMPIITRAGKCLQEASKTVK